LGTQVLTEENGFDRTAQLAESLVRRVLQITAREPLQQRIGIGCSCLQGRRVFDHHVILSANHLPIDRLPQDLFEMGIEFRGTIFHDS